MYKGVSGNRYLHNQVRSQWLRNRKLGLNIEAGQKQKAFIKDIFVAIDEDNSGTMDHEELIKALLCLGLSQDLNFSKRIIKVFQENKAKNRDKARRRQEVKEGFIFVDEEEELRDEEYTLRDFLSVFTQDHVGAKIIEVINHEIELLQNLDINKQNAGGKVDNLKLQKQSTSMNQEIRPEVAREIMKYLQYLDGDSAVPSSSAPGTPNSKMTREEKMKHM